ncbi:cytochrome c biogenesis protein [Blattabacterium cuenoti]|uniref:cytochrome c biogenesis protein n=1 Tax=Blattabacterium cuenoti TaxID=1653831 RepID=UPI001EEB1750|nr:cytochrome c biogenesis protein CcsA [Blattabacterium cuenoti]
MIINITKVILNNLYKIILIVFITNHLLLSNNNHQYYNSLNNISQQINISKTHGENFSKLLVQDEQGRIKPINSLALDLLRKIHKKSYIGNINANQWIISIHQNSLFWASVPFIKVDKTGGKTFLHKVKSNKDGYVSMIDLYYFNKTQSKFMFLFQKDYELAFSKDPAKRNNYDKAVINLSEKLGILHGILQGKYLRIFPIKNDNNHTWSSWIITNNNNYYDNKINTIGFIMFNHYLRSLFKSQYANNWNYADNEVKKIKLYQIKYAQSILPSNRKIDMEILYNKLNIFYLLPFIYLCTGILLIIYSFYNIFYENKYINYFYNFLSLIIFLSFLLELFGLILRWYIAEHPPWSNGYESAIFISWCLIVIGLLFYKNKFVLGITSLCSFILLIIASGDIMDPEITHLVPVLKSHWLIIHVAIITSSYGFFFTGSVIGLFVLILHILYNYNENYRQIIDLKIRQLTIINEISITIGLFLLTIGTFLGSIWANISWGRYWSWDPKETWALITIMIYACILHLRLIPSISKNILIFNCSSMFAILSIIMTYFGVNYYLSGLHSYAKGDPIFIPYWIYLYLCILGGISIFSFYSNKYNNKINHNKNIVINNMK